MTNDGEGVQSLQLVDTRTDKVVQTLPYPSPESLYMGLAWSPDGRTAYASAAANSKIRVLSLANGRLTERGPIKLPTKTADGKAVTLFPAGLADTPDGKKLVIADQLGDAVTVTDTVGGPVQTVTAGHRPVWVTLSKDGRTAYVSNQGANTVDVVDVAGSAPRVRGQIKVGLHPNKSVLSPDGRRLYVANGDADSVSEVDLRDTVILVTEDEAQNGPDHVDAHRTLALAISPYTQTGKVDSTFYSTASMVRTIELIAGIGPLTRFDEYSTPMSASFTDKPNYRAYSVIKPTYPMNSINGAGVLARTPGGK
ncbi:beta-propeller fold lactonase family protein [Streptomyces sp. NPDC001795]|uniref:YncE family protein n=1 Tax=Streptomyces sp. NPDC001795 TaxID=3154525 RepID=UPI00331C8249